MSFEDYAIVEHVSAIRGAPNERVGINIGFSARDLLNLFQMTEAQLVMRPHASLDGKEATRSQIDTVSFNRGIEDNKIQSSVVANSTILMPSFYSTVGFAAKLARPINLFADNMDTSQRTVRPLDPKTFLDFEDKILIGTKAFFGSMWAELGSPQRTALLVAIEPRLNNG